MDDLAGEAYARVSLLRKVCFIPVLRIELIHPSGSGCCRIGCRIGVWPRHITLTRRELRTSIHLTKSRLYSKIHECRRTREPENQSTRAPLERWCSDWFWPCTGSFTFACYKQNMLPVGLYSSLVILSSTSDPSTPCARDWLCLFHVLELIIEMRRSRTRH